MAKSSTSYQKGQSGNPKGRPKKGETLAEMFRDALSEPIKETDEGSYTRLHKIIDKVVAKAEAGDQQAIEYALARGFGKLIDRVESANVNKQYDFKDIPIEERKRVLEALKLGTVRNESPDSDQPDTGS
jgi:hypothetical protein